MKHFSKITAILTALILIITLAACGSETEKSSVSGEYFTINMTLETAYGGFNENIIEKMTKNNFVQGTNASEGTLETNLFNYSWTVKDDILTLEVTEDKSPTAAIANSTGEKTEYIIYKDCLIDKTSDIYEITGGDVNIKKGKIDTSYECISESGGITEYTSVAFDSQDNYCEIEYYTTFNGEYLTEHFFEGTYAADGNLVTVDIADYTDSEGTIREGGTFYMYISDDGSLYTTMYKKS